MQKTRAQLQEKGQFWTPGWIAENMARYALMGGADHVFDPAYGMGAFFVAANKIKKEFGKRKINFYGGDIDPDLIKEIKKNKLLAPAEVANLVTQDFIKAGTERKYKSIVVNPPYIRHHKISSEQKVELKKIAKKYLDTELDGRAGLHIYFLILSLLSLEKNGRMSFIVSSGVCEGVFSGVLWSWIAKNYQIEAVLTFTGDATPFPNIDTNPIVFFIKNSQPKANFSWAKCLQEDGDEIKKWISSGFDGRGLDKKKMIVSERTLSEGLKTGLSREPQTEDHKFTLGDFAYAMRGIATGNNDYFLITQETAKKFNIPDSYLVPAIARTRDLTRDVIDEDLFKEMETRNRPYSLLYIDDEKIEDLPKSLKEYIYYGEQNGVHKTPLISTRKPWFKMERRDPPPIFFSYLGRRNSRFIHNKVGALPLNGFLCIYPKSKNKNDVKKLLKLINHKEVLKNLFLVGKSYGSDAVKVEPRALERLPIPEDLVKEYGLEIHPTTLFR